MSDNTRLDRANSGGLSEREAIRRLHDRLGFGAGTDLTRAQQGTFSAAVGALLAQAGRQAQTTADPHFDEVPVITKAAGTAERQQRRRALAEHRTVLLSWWLQNAVTSPTQLTEKLAWFWHGHFATSIQKVKLGPLMYRQHQTHRRLGTASFTDLAQAMVVDPAMLIWLDGNDNTAASPNENLAREFMELFTLGHGNYSEQDVRQAAKALTGWTVQRKTGKAHLVPGRHDNGDVQVLGSTGPLDARGLVTLILSQPASAPFVIGRLWSRLVSATPPDAATLQRLVDAYGRTRDIVAVLRAITATPQFTDVRSSLVKQPAEWLIGLLRAAAVPATAIDQKVVAALTRGLRQLGQVPFAPPSVGGWPAGRSWLTTASSAARIALAVRIARLARHQLAGIGGTGPALAEGLRVMLGVDAWTGRTLAAITATGKPSEAFVVAACSPEYLVSR